MPEKNPGAYDYGVGGPYMPKSKYMSSHKKKKKAPKPKGKGKSKHGSYH